ncbi:MAG: hypothetical protein ACLFUU_10065 [Desulfobacteraceae bacterium]
MKKFFTVVALVGILLMGIGSANLLAFPNPPNFANTTWTGLYEIAYNTGWAGGSITMVITHQFGSRLRGNVILSPPLGDGTTPIPWAGFFSDGKFNFTSESFIASGELIWDKIGNPPGWKAKGIGFNPGVMEGVPYLPCTVWFNVGLE